MSKRSRVLLLLAVAALLYANTLLNGFTLDDDGNILRNPAVTAPSLSGLFQPTTNNVFRPGTFGTFALNWAVGGNRAFDYHLVNILLHVAVTFFLYMVLSVLLENLPGGELVAWTTALLFAVHPIHTEAVASVSGRSELLAALLLMAAWLLHLKDRPIAAVFCFALSLLSKESAVVFAPLVLAGDYVRGRFKQVIRYISILGVTALYLALLWKVQGGRFGEYRISLLDNPLAHVPPGTRVLNAICVAWRYIALQIYPVKLSCDYSYNTIPLNSNLWTSGLAVTCAVIVLAMWLWVLVTKRREWFLAGSLYLIGFATTANVLIPTGTIMGERLAYLPSAGFCLLLALTLILLLKSRSRLTWTVITVVVVVASARTVLRNEDWRDNFTLFSKDIKAVPGSAKLHAMLGGQYMLRGQLDLAHGEFDTALQIYPDYPEVLDLCSIIESRTGQDEQAVYSLRKAVSIAEKGSASYDSIAMDLAIELTKIGRNDDALNLMDEVIKNSPGYSPAWSNRAAIYYGRGERSRARQDATTALRLDPTNSNAKQLLSLLPSDSSAYQ
jgi:Tfp pilus assembly protein PilF